MVYRIVVIGGITRRIIAEVDEMPGPGRTVITHHYDSHTGGRGAFSAVAAYRLSHRRPPNDDQEAVTVGESEISVRLVGAIGSDDIGQPIKNRIAGVGVNTDRVRTIPNTRTGLVFVLVDEESDGHSVVMCPGANYGFKPDDFDSADKLLEECGGVKPDLLVTNCELRRATVEQLIKTAVDAEVPILLNLVPEESLFPEDLAHLTHLIVHKTEARRIDGDCPSDEDDPNDWENFAKKFLDRGVANVVVTLGSQGAYFSNRIGEVGDQGHISSENQNVDEIGGGEMFVGAYAVEYTRHQATSQWNIRKAVEQACRVAATFGLGKHQGCIEPIPWADELE